MFPFTICMYLLCSAKGFQVGEAGRSWEPKYLGGGQRGLKFNGPFVWRCVRPSQTPVAPRRWQHALIEKVSKVRAACQKRGASHRPVKSFKGGGVIRKISSAHDQPAVAVWSRGGFAKVLRPNPQLDLAALPPFEPLPRPHPVPLASFISTSSEWRNGSGPMSAAVWSGVAGFPRKVLMA